VSSGGGMFPPSMSRSHFPTRLFTPSMPNPHSGQPNPRATVVGNANGIEAAERYVIARIGGAWPLDARRIGVETAAFSGMDRNEVMLYLAQYLKG